MTRTRNPQDQFALTPLVQQLAAATAASDTLEAMAKSKHGETLDRKLREVIAGWEMGDALAKSLKPGDAFLGSMGHAEVNGLKRDTPQYNGFLIGFAGALPGRVVTKDGVLTEYR